MKIFKRTQKSVYNSENKKKISEKLNQFALKDLVIFLLVYIIKLKVNVI